VANWLLARELLAGFRPAKSSLEECAMFRAASAKPQQGLARSARLGGTDLTVAECLKFTPLDRGEVLSGHRGLGRKVRWVHVVDHSDPEDSLADGELLLTSGIALSQDAPLRAQIFGIMQRHDSAGLVIALGRYMQEVPPEMLAAGDAAGIPVIALPWEVNFGDITRALLTPLIHAHYRFLERSEELGRDLLELLLQRAEAAELCERIAGTLGRAVGVIDAGGMLLAACQRGTEVFGRERLPPIAASLAQLDHAAGGTRHVIVGTRLRAIAIPLAATRSWVVLDGMPGPLPRWSLLTAETGAAAVALLLTYAEEIAAARHGAGQTLKEVLEGLAPITPTLMRQLGLVAGQSCTLLLVQPWQGMAAEMSHPVSAALSRLFGVRAGVALGDILAFVLQRQTGRALHWAERLAAGLAEAGHPCRLVLGRPDLTLGELGQGYAAALEALTLGRMLRPQATVLRADQTVMLARLVRDLPPGGHPQQTSPAILKLEEQDRSLHGSLIDTLEILLEADGNVSLAARRLRIHRHTLLYRLGRIRDILDQDLDSASRLELRLQLMAWRLGGR
jgi:purine catabolism regulator